MTSNLADKLRRNLSESRQISLANMKPRNIDWFLARLPHGIRWRPDYLFKDTKTNKYVALTVIYETKYFPNVLAEQVKEAVKKYNFDFFFVLENEKLLDIFAENCCRRGFGLILKKGEDFILMRDAVESIIPKNITTQYVGHYPLWVIQKINNINLGNSKFRTLLTDFSKQYLTLKTSHQLNWEKEELLVKNTIAGILMSDPRYTTRIDSFEILNRFEGLWRGGIRDHYFHSFHIFLLGLLILHQYKSEFISYYKTNFPKYGESSIEFLWLLTSIFHDVGYPIADLDDLKEDFYGVSTLPYEKEVSNVWEDPVYKENLKQLVSLFKFSLSIKKHRIDWHPEVFGSKDDKLVQVIRDSFHDCHGVASCFRFLVQIFSEARQEKDEEKRIFLIYHIYPSALSIALHDGKFREKLSTVGMTKIKLSRFPFAVLLSYLDSLQEDRRERFLCIDTPELLKGFVFNGKVKANVDESLLKNYPRLGKLRAECTDLMNFVECDGIKFEYPKLLLI